MEPLRVFVFKPPHSELMQRRSAWIEPLGGPPHVTVDRIVRGCCIQSAILKEGLNERVLALGWFDTLVCLDCDCGNPVWHPVITRMIIDHRERLERIRAGDLPLEPKN